MDIVNIIIFHHDISHPSLSLSLCTLSEPEEAAGAQFKAEDTSCVDEEEEEEENTTKKDNSTTVSV
jgi:hypothetical protein